MSECQSICNLWKVYKRPTRFFTSKFQKLTFVKNLFYKGFGKYSKMVAENQDGVI
jgi:hypothetical protein